VSAADFVGVDLDLNFPGENTRCCVVVRFVSLVAVRAPCISFDKSLSDRTFLVAFCSELGESSALSSGIRVQCGTHLRATPTVLV